MPDPLSFALSNAPVEVEEIGSEEEQAVAESHKWFKNNQGTPLEAIVAQALPPNGG